MSIASILSQDASLFLSMYEPAMQAGLPAAVSIALGRWLVYLIAGAVVLLWFRADPARRHADRLAVVNALWAGALASVAKAIVATAWFRPRPFVDLVLTPLVTMDPSSASFPSGHATFAFGVATSIALYDRRFGFPLLLLAALVSFGRVLVGVHYPLDVVSGAILGIAIAFAIRRVGFRLDHRIVHLFSRLTDRSSTSTPPPKA